MNPFNTATAWVSSIEIMVESFSALQFEKALDETFPIDLFAVSYTQKPFTSNLTKFDVYFSDNTELVKLMQLVSNFNTIG